MTSGTVQTVKDYIPMSVSDARRWLGADKCNQFQTEGEILIYAEIMRMHVRLTKMEKEAADMASPEKLMAMASSVMGVRG